MLYLGVQLTIIVTVNKSVSSFLHKSIHLLVYKM